MYIILYVNIQNIKYLDRLSQLCIQEKQASASPAPLVSFIVGVSGNTEEKNHVFESIFRYLQFTRRKTVIYFRLFKM